MGRRVAEFLFPTAGLSAGNTTYSSDHVWDVAGTTMKYYSGLRAIYSGS